MNYNKIISRHNKNSKLFLCTHNKNLELLSKKIRVCQSIGIPSSRYVNKNIIVKGLMRAITRC